MATVLLIPHVDAGDRTVWVGDHGVRPLSELGRRQAEALAKVLERRNIGALYASPALRARQTLEPLGRELGLEIEVTMGVAEKQVGRNRPAMVARGWAALQGLADEAGNGTLAAASHGDMIPALAQHLVAVYGLMPLPDITRRGQWYEIEIEGEEVWVTLSESPADFPL